MKKRFPCTLLLLCTPIIIQAATSYIDEDLDGVEDTIDLCPDTPFDILVDEHGCNIDKTIPGKLTLQFGVTQSNDPEYDTDTLINLYLSYRYNAWEFSLASANYNTTNLSSAIDTEDDLFLTVGYHWEKSAFSAILSAGTKFAFLKQDETDRDNDYYLSFNMNYKINDHSNFFGYYSYTWSSDTVYTDYENFHTVTIGAGYHLYDPWYTSLSYNYVSAYYKNGSDYHTLSWFNAYMLTDDTFVSLNYAYGLNEEAYDHTFTLNIGAFFE